MNKVYIVTEWFIDVEYIDEVFDTEENAKKYIENCEKPHKYCITEYKVNTNYDKE